MIKKLLQTTAEIIIAGALFLFIAGFLIWRILIEPNLWLIILLITGLVLIVSGAIAIVLGILIVLALARPKESSIYN